MKTRNVTIFNGAVFEVPKNICRIDIVGPKRTHGWQVRYGKPWKMFSDRSLNGSGAVEALKLATEELRHRIETLPAPSGIRRVTSYNKTSDLPPGISGPFKRKQHGRNCSYFYLQLSLPVFGEGAVVKQIYLGNDNTYTEERLREGIKEGVELRRKYIITFEEKATQNRRESMA